ncbi:MAG: hypothetical protein ACOYXB_10070 [Bacteroidota bacterium]
MKTLVVTLIVFILSLSGSLLLDAGNVSGRNEITPERVVIYQLTGYGKAAPPVSERWTKLTEESEAGSLIAARSQETAIPDGREQDYLQAGLYQAYSSILIKKYFQISASPCDILISAAQEH